MSKGKLIITVGISGSGKSTWAHEKWESDPQKYVIISRDKIRELLFGYTELNIGKYYALPNISKFEKQVTRYEDTLINDALNHGRVVIVDATHLTRKYLQRFSYWNVETAVTVFSIELEEAISRDLKRTRKVGDVVIQKQYNRFINLIKDLSTNPIDFTPITVTQDMNSDNPAAFIFDIDGTMAHMNRETRSPYDWHKVGEDEPDVATCAMVKYISSSEILEANVIICTGRDAVCINETKKWLSDNNIKYDEIHFRKEGDQRADWIVKEEMWRKIAEDNYIVAMFDDRLQVVRRARALGLKVFNVEYNNF
jgi:predicted kinase